jgi:Alpha/beta hydrolase
MKTSRSAAFLSTIAFTFLLGLSLNLRAQPKLTDAQLLALRPTPTNLVPASGTFWSVSLTNYPPLPCDPFPSLPAYHLPDGSWLYDDSAIAYPPPPPRDAAAAARLQINQANQQALISQRRMASPMLDDSGPPPLPDPTNSLPVSYTPQLLSPPPPTNGTFWFLINSNYPPLFWDPFPDCPVYLLFDGSYLIDDSSVNWAEYFATNTPSYDPPPQRPEPHVYTNGLWLQITGVSNSIAHVILHGTTAGTAYTILSRQSWQSNDPWDSEMPLTGADGQDWTPFQVETFGRRVLFLWAEVGTVLPQRLWLQSIGISGGYYNLILHGTSGSEQSLYDILSTGALSRSNNWNNWAVETNSPAASGQYWTPISISLSARPRLFLAARSWTTTDGSIPDWWLLQNDLPLNTDPYALCPCGDGWTILQAWQNGWNPNDWHTPPAPTGLTVKYFGPSTNIIVTWASCPGPILSYTVARSTFSYDATNYFSLTNQTTLLDAAPASMDPNFPAAYQVRAEYQGGPSAWSAIVSVFAPDISLEACSGGGQDFLGGLDYMASTTADAAVVRGPQGNLYLVTGHVPASVVKLRIWASPIIDSWNAPKYPLFNQANYLWEWPQPFTNEVSSGYWEVDPAALQSGFIQLPVALVPPYGTYALTVETVAADGRVSDCRPIWGSAQVYSQIWLSDAWDWPSQSGAVPFLDGRRHIQQNIEFQLRAAQGRHIGPTTNEVPFAVEQQACINGRQCSYDESASVSYVEAGFHHYYGPDMNNWWTWQGLALDPFRPFEQNYFYANWLSTSLPWGAQPKGLWLPYSGYTEGTMEVDQPYRQFSVWSYVNGGGTNPVPALLFTNDARWIFAADVGALNQFAGDWETNAWDGNTRSNYTVYADYSNLYGLGLRSVVTVDHDPWSSPACQFRLAYPGDTLGSDANLPYFFEVDRPQLVTIGYYFAPHQCVWTPPDAYGGQWAYNLYPRPGESGFTTGTQSPLMITSIGQPFFVAAWAKQALTNGFTNVFAYPEQYFDRACTIDANGSPTTNSAGLLSPYGEFFPTVPGPAALRTMADIDTGQQGTGIVNIIKLQLDVDHNGQMDLSFGGPDNTSQARPYPFWINNDCDYWSHSGDPGHDVNDPEMPDYKDVCIPSQRDLEDWARLWICGVPALTNANCQVTLSWANISSGSPTINLVEAAEPDGGTSYLTDSNASAAYDLHLGGPRAGKFGTVSSNSPLVLPNRFFTNNIVKHFLFEGAALGSGELVLTITQNATNVIGRTGAWLDLRDIKDFFEQVVITNNMSGAVSNWTGEIAGVQAAALSPTDEGTNIIVLVHGINVGDWDWLQNSETAFKRLYWQGYRGRFTTVKWPCNFLTPPNIWDPAVFNLSELKAYKASTALKDYLTQLRARFPGYRLNILAHSQGNVVASEALKQGAPFDTYVLTQGAVPASAYDANALTNTDLTSREYGPFITPEWQPLGYHGAYTNLSGGRMVNFYNPSDGVLAIWLLDQKIVKPSQFYSYDGTDCWYLVDGDFNLYRRVTDTQESRSMISRSRSWPIGMQGPVPPLDTQGVINDSVNLFMSYGFYNAVAEHSAEFTRPIQTVWYYYRDLLRAFAP